MQNSILLLSFLVCSAFHYNFFSDYFTSTPHRVEPPASFEDQVKNVEKAASLHRLYRPSFLEDGTKLNAQLLRIIAQCTIIPQNSASEVSPLLRTIKESADDEEKLEEVIPSLIMNCKNWMTANCHTKITPSSTFLRAVALEYGGWQNYVSSFCHGNLPFNPFTIYLLSAVLRINFVVFSSLHSQPRFISGFMDPSAHALTVTGKQLPTCPLGMVFTKGRELIVLPLRDASLVETNCGDMEDADDESDSEDDELENRDTDSEAQQVVHNGSVHDGAEETHIRAAKKNSWVLPKTEKDIPSNCLVSDEIGRAHV